MMELKELSTKIYPCDIDKPFVFVSYSSKDSLRVWNDVYRLQKAGFNIWIDTNLTATDDSWKEALEIIKDVRCVLVVFYLSEHSVTSVPCLEELRTRESQDTRNTHNGNAIPLLVVETQQVGDVVKFRKKTYDSIINNSLLSREERNIKATTLSQMMDTFFPNNDKLRVLCEEDASRREEYFTEIESELLNAGVKKLSPEEMYERGVILLGQASAYKNALEYIDTCANEHKFLPAILLRAFIYEAGIHVVHDHAKAEEELFWASFQMEEGKWLEEANLQKQENKLTEAVAYFIAVGLKQNSAESFLEASKIWMKLSNYIFTLKCAELASELGHADGRKLYQGLKNMTEAKFLQYTKSLK